MCRSRRRRIEAEKIRSAARRGEDPRRVLNAEADADKAIPTFGAFADERLPIFKTGLKNKKTLAKWDLDLGKRAEKIRDIRIDKVTTAEVLALPAPPRWRANCAGAGNAPSRPPLRSATARASWATRQR
jgi:hypothetical protein